MHECGYTACLDDGSRDLGLGRDLPKNARHIGGLLLSDCQERLNEFSQLATSCSSTTAAVRNTGAGLR
jgi:hypothetical protein